jgi:hypothetical protein
MGGKRDTALNGLKKRMRSIEKIDSQFPATE